jgi:superfamily I DNA/RNA helicase
MKQLQSLKATASSVQSLPAGSEAAVVLQHYETTMRASNTLDFYDLVRLSIEIFSSSPPLLQEVQRVHKYILVDEFQACPPPPSRDPLQVP